MNNLKPFKIWCQKVLPLVYDDSLSYYELLCKVVDTLNITIKNVNTLDTEFSKLQNYVNNYFDNLDVQNEINNKLDSMVKDGTLDKIISLYFSFFVTPESYGCVGDGIADDTKNFQKAINSGYPILLKNKYLITDTLKIKSGAQISGYQKMSWDLNSGILNEDYPYIKFNPSNTSKYLFELDESTIKNQYVHDVSISNIQIMGNNNLGCFNLTKLANSLFENLTIFGFQNVFLCDFLMRVRFIGINATGFTTAIKAINSISTTTSFKDCYFGQSEVQDSKVISCEKNTCYKFIFDNCVFETLYSICKSNGQNFIEFNNCYSENIPLALTDNPIALFNCNGESIITKDIIIINSCYLQGNNNYKLENSFVFSNNEFVNYVLTNSVIKIFKNIFSPNFNGFATLQNNTEISVNPINISSQYANYTNETNLVSYYNNPNSKTRDRFINLENAWSPNCYIAEHQDVIIINISGVCNGNKIGSFSGINITGVGEIIDATTGSDSVKVLIISNEIVAVGAVNGHTYIGTIVLARN